jgi:hypothetical protein
MLGWLSLGSLVAVPVAAKTIHVPADEPKIQAAVLAASAGDTVLVAPGTYTELIQMRNGVVLRSAAGPDSTFLLTPQLEESPLDERLLECLGGIDRSTVIEGFSLDGSAKPGAGIYCENGSPTIRGNRISGFGWGINLRHSTALIEENVIEKTTTFGILAFASSPEIYRNEFANNGGRVIVISGKLSQPIVGGSRENANKFFGNRIVVSNSSRNDVDATWNDWGWETTVEMNREGYPADIVAIVDGNDFERTNRGRGKVDYRHWILPEGEAAGTGPGSLLAGRTWIPIAAAAILVVVFVVLSRRSRTAANT